MTAVLKVWIEEGCITCDACQGTCPEVFLVTDESCFIKAEVREEGGVMDMQKANLVEPVRVVEQAIQSATETATMVIRIDDVISSKGVSMGDEAMMDGMDF